LQPQADYSLRHHNSFGFDVRAEYFVCTQGTEQLRDAVQWARDHDCALHVLGDGSNTVFSSDVDGLVLKIGARQIDSEKLSAQAYRVIADAGVNWHALVEHCLATEQYGLENLAMIPGSAGAAPIQNIGAYGIELAQLLDSVEIFDTTSGQCRQLNAAQCQFSYRHSIFKTRAARNWIVTRIHLNLSAADKPCFHYAALQQSLQAANIQNPASKDVFDHVCKIRSSKLPDPKVLGNAGSFFKNPIVSAEKMAQLLARYPQIAHYPEAEGRAKIAAGWLIEQAGWKGYRRDAVGVHDNQALVLVNYGGGTGQQIATLANDIRVSIREKFDVELEQEPVLVPADNSPACTMR